MGAVVFDNNVFDSWLTKKSDEILSKVDREKISTEEMLVLILKAQTNHFHHMEIEFRNEFQKIDQRFNQLEAKFGFESNQLDIKITALDAKLAAQSNQLDAKITAQANQLDAKITAQSSQLENKFDRKFDQIWSFQKWQAGTMIALFAGIYLKLFFG